MLEERKKTKSDEGKFPLYIIERLPQKISLDDDFVLVQQVNNQWPNLFDIYFLSPTTRLAQISTSTTSDDDLVFYVTRKTPNDSQDSSVSLKKKTN